MRRNWFRGRRSGPAYPVRMISRMSTLFVRTLREDPADAEVPSHRLLVRAGYIRRAAPGIYTWLPLGLRVLRRIEGIIREEMDAIGAQEVSFPALLPREPYEATGRWTEYGDGLFRLQDRKGADYLLGPTHEEMFTLLVKDLYGSYKDLPLSIYQIQTKYRDEARPRAGILRGREFTMKDSYSFDVDDAGLEASYQKHREAYIRIFDRLGFDYVIVKAMSGAMGGSGSEEFLAKAEVGEDTYVRCTNCDYAANVEAVEIRPSPRRHRGGQLGDAPAAHAEQTPDTPDHRDPGRPPQRDVPPRGPAVDGGGHAQERRVQRAPPRRHDRGARRRPARRPRGGHEAARGRARRGRAFEPFGEADFAARPTPGQGLHRARRVGGEGRGRRALPRRPPRRRRHPVGDRRRRVRQSRPRPGRRPRLHAGRVDRGRRGPRRRPVPQVRRRHPRVGARHRDGSHLPARPQVRRRARPAGARRERQARDRHDGLLRHRTVARGRRDRGEHPRRDRAVLAARCRDRSTSTSSPPARTTRSSTRRRSWPPTWTRGRRGALRRPAQGESRREVQGRRADRSADDRHRRARPRGRDGRGQGPPDR